MGVIIRAGSTGVQQGDSPVWTGSHTFIPGTDVLGIKLDATNLATQNMLEMYASGALVFFISAFGTNAFANQGLSIYKDNPINTANPLATLGVNALTANRTYNGLNINGDFVLVGNDPPAVAAGNMGKVDSASLAASVALTNLTNTAFPLNGNFLLTYYAVCRTAVAGSQVVLSFSWTDVQSARTVTATLPLTTAGTILASTLVIQRNSVNISYLTTLTGTGTYGLYIRLLALG